MPTGRAPVQADNTRPEPRHRLRMVKQRCRCGAVTPACACWRRVPRDRVRGRMRKKTTTIVRQQGLDSACLQAPATRRQSWRTGAERCWAIPDRQMSQGTRSLVRSRGLWRVEGPASDDNNFRSDADPGWSGCASAQRTADGHAVTASRRAANGFPRRKHESAARENGVSILRLRIPPLLSC